ncbi:hypothetical protein MW290_20995 [Aquincola tertiaricarbonis]|uniref:Uncharacterized protein n=1 Tax=Aquincola tertiaricarbonis TaxID=391953 RepID=A0ABY4SDM4_AQUTE|nr:hypothetical protein [Aquincola tertiaricarbonis]URI11423.1 hypothetical protein MW290_20995 [Aquincola tertiaricarbonis]
MDEFKSLHYEGDHGKLVCEAGNLCSVADLVRAEMHFNRTPLRPAVRSVLDKLEGQSAVRVYVTQPRDYAVLVPATIEDEDRRGVSASGRASTARSVTRASLLERVRRHWLRDDMTEDGLHFRSEIWGGQLAMLIDDASDLGLLECMLAADGSAAACPAESSGALSNCQPLGGAWPHQQGAAWTHAERDAMFKMRHLEGLSDQQIADTAGCTRQLVAQQIGAKHDWKRKDWEGGARGWAPTPALLAECKLEPQPLQAVSKALSA